MSKYSDLYVEYEVIGRGSYGSAHLVRSKTDQRVYVAKKIHLSGLKAKEQEDSKREVTLLQKLKHPFIVQYIESFNENDSLIIIMEYCEEGDLSFHINRLNNRKEYFPEKVILNWFLQVALALKYIHEQKILHRDIKSQNIFVTSNGFVKIGDFGISRVLEHTYDQANTVVGTPYYMSPEVCENKPYTYKSDVWALGCVLYELCNLTHAFKSNNLLGLVNRIVKDQVSALPSHYSKELGELVQKLLCKRAEARPSISEVILFPIIKSVMNEFVQSQGQFKMSMPIKRTNTHNQIDKMIRQEKEQKQEETVRKYDNTIETVQSVDLNSMTPAQRVKWRKEEEVRQRQKQLEEAARSSLLEKQGYQQRKAQDLQGHKSEDFQQKRKQQQEYHDALQKQQLSMMDTKKRPVAQQAASQQAGTSYDETLVSRYEETSKMMQSQSHGDKTFKKEMEEFDRTVSSEMCESSYQDDPKEGQFSGSPKQAGSSYQISNSQLDRYTNKGLSVTQEYGGEEFEEYNSDEEDQYSRLENNCRLTIKSGQNEVQEVLKIYQQNLENTVKKQGSTGLEDIKEVSQESWTSAQSPGTNKVIVTREERVANLKKQAIQKLGSQLYNQVYSFLSHHVSKESPSAEVRQHLQEMVGKQRMADCMILDEILWLENINK